MQTLSFPEFLGAFGKRDLYERLSPDGKNDHARYDEIKGYFDLFFIKESSRYFESELDIEIFEQLFQASE